MVLMAAHREPVTSLITTWIAAQARAGSLAEVFEFAPIIWVSCSWGS